MFPYASGEEKHKNKAEGDGEDEVGVGGAGVAAEVYDTRTDPAVQVLGGGRGAAEEGGSGVETRGASPFEFHLGCGALPEVGRGTVRAEPRLTPTSSKGVRFQTR